MRLEKIEFGALLSYSPHGITQREVLSRSVRTAVKNDEFIISSSRQVQMSDFVAQSVKKMLRDLPFSHIFDSRPVLVPIPSSSLKKPDSLWVPNRIALALRSELGGDVAECLVRVKPLPKSATSAASNRSTAAQHFESLEVQKLLAEPKLILLVDDVVTRGATLLGAANRLAETYPNARIAAFVALRTVSNPQEFKSVNEAVSGFITLQPSGGTLRRP
jgi:phosphoribosylpyrophosphate synthetase